MIKVLVNNSPTKVRVFFVTAKHSHIFLEIFFCRAALQTSINCHPERSRGIS